MQDLYDVLDFLACACDPGPPFAPPPPLEAKDEALLCREVLVFAEPPPTPPDRPGPVFCAACEADLRALGKN